MTKKKFLSCLALSLSVAFACISFAACAPSEGGGENKVPDPPAPSSKTTVQWVYTSKEYTDADGNAAKLDYAYYVPETAGSEKLPLITWIPDSGSLNKSIQEVTELGSFPTIWATEAMLESCPAAVLALTLTPNSTTDSAEATYLDALRSDEDTSEEKQVLHIIDDLVAEFDLDADRLYYTGQSMGGIFGWALNTVYPEKFAATVYVGCQPGSSIINTGVQAEMYSEILSEAEFLNQKFIYIGSLADPGTNEGQTRVKTVFDENEVSYIGYYELDSKDPAGNSSYLKENVFTDDCSNYFLAFPESAGIQHLQSFKPAYQITAILEWLLEQR
ncbi:MAG: hypothetical protein ACI4MC_04990 [Candidatus Coproplasma sp.]